MFVMIRNICKSMLRPVSVYVEATPVRVQNSLAVTPSEMKQLADEGIPISAQQNAASYFDGDTTPYVDVPSEFRRGYDAIDAYTEQINARERLRRYKIKH